MPTARSGKPLNTCSLGVWTQNPTLCGVWGFGQMERYSRLLETRVRRYNLLENCSNPAGCRSSEWRKPSAWGPKSSNGRTTRTMGMLTP